MELVSTDKAIGLALNGKPRLLLSKFLVIHQAPTLATIGQKVAFLRIPFLSTCKKITLKVKVENGKKSSDMGLILPCESLAVKQLYPTHMLLSGSTLTLAHFPYSEHKMSKSLKKAGKTTTLVEKTLRPNLCLKSRKIHKHIAGSPHPYLPNKVRLTLYGSTQWRFRYGNWMKFWPREEWCN